MEQRSFDRCLARHCKWPGERPGEAPIGQRKGPKRTLRVPKSGLHPPKNHSTKAGFARRIVCLLFGRVLAGPQRRQKTRRSPEKKKRKKHGGKNNLGGNNGNRVRLGVNQLRRRQTCLKFEGSTEWCGYRRDQWRSRKKSVGNLAGHRKVQSQCGRGGPRSSYLGGGLSQSL